jgi:hypothetical protein
MEFGASTEGVVGRPFDIIRSLFHSVDVHADLLAFKLVLVVDSRITKNWDLRRRKV